jgi:hypothetical protein
MSACQSLSNQPHTPRGLTRQRRGNGELMTTLPEKFSYPKKPVTMAVPGLFTKCRCTPTERLGGAIRNYTELTGIVPFDWEYVSPVPEAYQSRMARPDDEFCTFLFGFDTMEEALAVEAKFNAINGHVVIWTEEEEREDLRLHLEHIEKQGDERPTYDGGDGRGPMYWRDHPYFQEGWRDYCQQLRPVRATVPEKFSYPEKPITLHVPVIFTKSLGSTEEQLGDAICHFTELAGIVPYNWEHITSVPEAHQSKLKSPDDKLYLVWFGFDTMDEASAVKAKFDAVNRYVVITDEAESSESLTLH